MSFEDHFGRKKEGYQNIFSSPMEYDNNFQAVSNNIQQLSNNVSQLKQLVNQIGTSKDSVELREKLNSLIQTTRTLSKDTAQDFKLLDYEKAPTQEERNKKKLLQQKLMKDFQTWLQKYQEISKMAAEKERSSPLPKKTFSYSSIPISEPTISSGDKLILSTNDNIAEKNQTLLNLKELQTIEEESVFQNAIIAEREEGIKQIEKTVLEVNEIFRDVANLVQEQGQMIDNIESNIEVSVSDVSQGVEEIKKASDYQKRSRTKLCCLTLLVIIIVAVVVIVIWMTVKK
jgi:t-SNARE complex subunit (syntaxin)